MMNQHHRIWRLIGVSCLTALVGAATLWAQNPSYRPNVQWHIAAPSGCRAYAFTEDSKYLVVAGGIIGDLVQVYDVDRLADPNTPRGAALVSFDNAGDGLFFFTDKDEEGNEYVVRSYASSVTMWRWVRNQNAYGGGYLEKPQSQVIRNWASGWSGYPTALVLRGDRADRRYNRLAVSGNSSGSLLIARLQPNIQAITVAGAHSGAISALAYDPASRRLISGGVDGLIRVWQVSLDANNTPSLTPLQTIAAHRGPVTSLALAQIGANRYLVSASLEGILHGWRWNATGNLPINPSPLWSQPIELFYTDSLNSEPVLHSAPYGDYEWIVLSVMVPGAHTGWSNIFVIDPQSGLSLYRLSATFPLQSPRTTPVVISPKNNSNERYWAGNITSGANSFAGVCRQPSFRYPQTIATHNASATAIDSIAMDNTTRYLAVGFADGVIHLYRNTGSGWSQPTIITHDRTPHRDKCIVGVRLIIRDGSVFTLSADVEGQLAIAQYTNPPTFTTVTTGLSSAGALALGADDQTALVAVGGQKDGAPRVETLRLTWNGTTPTLAPHAGFSLTGQIGHVASLQFAGTSSADLIVSTGNRVSRWNFSNNNYTTAGNYDYPNYTFTYAPISTAGGTLYIGAEGITPATYNLDNRNRLSPFFRDRSLEGSNIGLFATVTSILALDSKRAVWGLAHQLPSRDGAYAIARGALIDDREAAYTTWNQEWHALLPDQPTAIARDPNDPEVFYVACLNGTVQDVKLPNFQPINPAGYAAIGGQFGLYSDKIYNIFNTFPPNAFYAYSNGDTNRAVALSINTGEIVHQAKLCNPNGTECEVVSGGFAFSNFATVSASGDVYFSELPALYAVSRVHRYDSSLANRPGFRQLTSDWWYPLLIDSDHLAYLIRTLRETCVSGTQTFNRWDLSLQVTNTQNFSDIGNPVPLNLFRDILRGNFYTGQDYKWDFNENKTLFAVLGFSKDDTTCASSTELRIVLYYRTGNNWLTSWQRGSVITIQEQGVRPTSLRFHPRAPQYLYVGLSNGRLRQYEVNPMGQVVNYIQYEPRTSPGAVAVMDVAEYVVGGVNQTALVFGGPNGLSIWGGTICRPNSFFEVAFYDTDIAFFSASGTASVRIYQTQPDANPYLVYGCGHVLSAAILDNLPTPSCAADVNGNRRVDDADLLEVLYNFGSVGFIPPDVNCDGIVDDADLLIVLFNFGNQC